MDNKTVILDKQFWKRSLFGLLVISSIILPLPVRSEETFSTYCKRIYSILKPQCISNPNFNEAIKVDFCIDNSGIVSKAQIPESFKGSESTKNAALAVINNLKRVDAPPSGAELPLCLSAYLSSRVDDLFVSVKDLDFQFYMQEMQRRIKRNWHPPKATEQRLSTLSFQILPDGNIRNLKIKKSSGAEGTDQAALEAVKSSVPLNKPPDGYFGNLDIEFTLDYKPH